MRCSALYNLESHDGVLAINHGFETITGVNSCKTLRPNHRCGAASHCTAARNIPRIHKNANPSRIEPSRTYSESVPSRPVRSGRERAAATCTFNAYAGRPRPHRRPARRGGGRGGGVRACAGHMVTRKGRTSPRKARRCRRNCCLAGRSTAGPTAPTAASSRPVASCTCCCRAGSTCPCSTCAGPRASASRRRPARPAVALVPWALVRSASESRAAGGSSAPRHVQVRGL